MKINTKYHGVKEYDEKDIITFRKGLPGFENLKKFILFSVEEDEVFNILHSVENEDVGLVIVSPFYCMKDYEFNLSDETIKELQVNNENEVLVLNVVTLSSKLENITINLKAPIAININKHLGEQIILDSSKYSIKHPLFKEGA